MSWWIGTVVSIPSTRSSASARCMHGDRIGACRLVHDQLADHRIVIRRHDVTAVRVRIESHAKAARRDKLLDPPRRRLEIAPRILRIDAAFDRRAALHDIGLRPWQRFAGRDANLRLDEVDPRDHFRHGVLDLNPGVDLDEIELAGLIDDELDRRGVRVVGRLNELAGPRRTWRFAFPA